MISQLNKPVSKQRAALVVSIVVGALLLGWGGWVVYGRLTGRPQTPAQVKRSIWKFIAKHGGGKDFKPPLDLSAPGVAGTGGGPTTTTNKAGRVRTVTKTAKNGGLDLPETTFSAYFRTNQEAVASYERIYKLIGEQLWVAEKLFESTEAAQQLTALVMAGEASSYARTNAGSGWLSARICEVYLWPHLALVEATNRAPFSAEAVLNLCDLAFKDAGETNHVISNYELLIAKAQQPQSDAARFKLAQIYLEQDGKAKALKLLKAIKTIKTAKIDREIATLEKLVPENQK